MNTSNLSYSVWGIFKNKNKLFLNKLQRTLRKDFNGPKFPLHITLSSGFNINQKDLLKKMKLIRRESKKFFVETNNFGYKNSFFQSIYLKIKINNNLTFQKKIIDRSLKSPKKKYFPHVSLYYGNLPILKKKEIIKKLKKYKKKLLIEEMYLVQNDEKDLKWKIIKKFKI
tara:strand:- start:185 stop:694 length:510 start_codon:yes stop_codon:yes gene_type:complete